MRYVMLILWMTIFSHGANACLCPTDTSEVEPEAVFLGKVKEIDPINSYRHFGDGPFMIVKIEVQLHYQGAKQDVIFIKTGLGNGDCGFDFQKDSLYLVYAENDEDYPTLYKTSQCLPTRRVSNVIPSDVRGLRKNNDDYDIDYGEYYYQSIVTDQVKTDLMAALAVIMMLIFLYRLRKNSVS